MTPLFRSFLCIALIFGLTNSLEAKDFEHEGVVALCAKAHSLLPVGARARRDAYDRFTQEFQKRSIYLPTELKLKTLLSEYALRSRLAGQPFDPDNGYDRGEFLSWVAAHPALVPKRNGENKPFPHEVELLQRIRQAARQEFAGARAEEMKAAGITARQLPTFDAAVSNRVLADLRGQFDAAVAAEKLALRGAKSYVAAQELLRELPDRPLSAAEADALNNRFREKVRPLLQRELPIVSLLRYPVLTDDWKIMSTDESSGLEVGLPRGAIRSPDQSISIAFQAIPQKGLRVEGMRLQEDGTRENQAHTVDESKRITHAEQDSLSCNGCHDGNRTSNNKPILDLQATGLNKSLRVAREKGTPGASDRGKDKKPMKPIEPSDPAYRRLQQWIDTARRTAQLSR